jgi:hypothetical protein
MPMAHPVLARRRRALGTGHRCLMTASEPLNPFGSYQSAVAGAVVGEPPSTSAVRFAV